MNTAPSFTRAFAFDIRAQAVSGLLLLISALAAHGAVVTEPTESALRSAIAEGGTVTFAVDGTIALASTLVISNDIVLDATGHQLTISGGQNIGVFQVNPAVHFVAIDLIIANGRATNGGAIYNDAGTVDLVGNVLMGNIATNANGHAYGGAVFNAMGTVNATGCAFVLNSAAGCSPPWYNSAASGFNGCGAAIFNLGNMNIAGCSFVQNSATGGAGTGGSSGLPNGGTGGSGGLGLGGAIYSVGPLTLNGGLIASNSVVGGAGGMGGGGLSAGCAAGYGGTGGAGGNAYGAALYATGAVTVVNCTFAWNRAVPSLGGPGGYGQNGFCHGIIIPGVPGAPGVGGPGMGGIQVSAGQCSLTNCSLAFNQGGGMRIAGGAVSVVNTLLCCNEPYGNSIGQPIDLGHNISSDATCAFTNLGSMNNTDPKLARLADYGGPTLTMALQWGSPAIDAGDTASAPATDERGYPRPLGLAADIGAFEYGLPVSMQASVTASGRLNIVVYAAPGQLCRLLASYDLVNWELFGINTVGPEGTSLFQDDTKNSSQRFYRAVLP